MIPALNFKSIDKENLRLRLISGAILAPIVLLLAFLGGWIYALAVIVCMMLGLREWLVLVPTSQLHVKTVSFVILFAIVASAMRPSLVMNIVFLVFYALDLYFWSMQEDFKKESAIGLTLGLLSLAAGGFSLIYLREMPAVGAELVCYLLAVVWGTDIGAYLAGNVIGGRKLAPVISPHKTWAGLIGGMVLAAILGSIVVLLFAAWKVWIAFIMAIVLAGIAQLGDLSKSIFKRRAGVKDSGHLIPGHGGMLDRIDGLVFASIFLLLFEMTVGKDVGWW